MAFRSEFVTPQNIGSKFILAKVLARMITFWKNVAGVEANLKITCI